MSLSVGKFGFCLYRKMMFPMRPNVAFVASNFAGAVTGTFRRARRVGMQHCAADALNLVPQWDGCAHAPWIERAAELHHASSSVADGSPVSNIVVGANKGYDAPSFLSLWSHSLHRCVGNV